MAAKLTIPVGTRYGRWVVISESGHNKRGGRLFKCSCDCGAVGSVSVGDLRSGHSKSCGCLRRERTIARNITHGLCVNPLDKHLFNVWRNMMDRCYRTAHRHYDLWGGRGIRVCDRWKDPEVFVKWGREGYYFGLTIERKDNNGNYEPENCIWATMQEQAQNRRPSKPSNRTHLIKHDGITLTITEWERRLGFTKSLISQRLKIGWSIEKALNTKAREYRYGD